MRLRASAVLAAALLLLASTASWAQLAPYSQDFEGLDKNYEWALADDGWLVYGNVFGPFPNWWWWYGYGPFGAPNHVYGFSAITEGEGGPEQGVQGLVVYSDYNNGNHGFPAWIESNVFQERPVVAADVGTTWRFEFDAKRGNIELNSTASAFVKTFTAGWALTNFIQEPMTYIPDTWDIYKIDVYIDASLVGGVVQFGFVNWATMYEGSGIFYDNVDFDLAPLRVNFDLRPEGCPNPINESSQGMLTAAVMGRADVDVTTIDLATLQLEGVAPVIFDIEDVGTPFPGSLCGCNAAGPDGIRDLTLKFYTQEFLDAIGPLGAGYHVLTLTGALHDGTEIEGQDCTVVVGSGAGGRVHQRLERTKRSRGVRNVGTQQTASDLQVW
jgi:hypothetical protein